WSAWSARRSALVAPAASTSSGTAEPTSSASGMAASRLRAESVPFEHHGQFNGCELSRPCRSGAVRTARAPGSHLRKRGAASFPCSPSGSSMIVTSSSSTPAVPAGAAAAPPAEEILAAVVFGAQDFLNHADWGQVLDAWLERLGRATASHRVLVFRNQ